MKKTVLTLGCFLFAQPVFSSEFACFCEDVPEHKRAFQFITVGKELTEDERKNLEKCLSVIKGSLEFVHQFKNSYSTKSCMTWEGLEGKYLLKEMQRFEDNY